MQMLKCYALSSPQINNGPFCFDCEERRGEKEHSTPQKKREHIRREEVITVHLMFICFDGKGRKERKRERKGR